MSEYVPGRPLPDAPNAALERQLYHARRADGEAATMTVDTGTWQWRRLHGGEGTDAYGSGSWSSMQAWLAGRN